jgi:hypothetical protein
MAVLSLHILEYKQLDTSKCELSLKNLNGPQVGRTLLLQLKKNQILRANDAIVKMATSGKLRMW